MLTAFGCLHSNGCSGPPATWQGHSPNLQPHLHLQLYFESLHGKSNATHAPITGVALALNWFVQKMFIRMLYNILQNIKNFVNFEGIPFNYVKFSFFGETHIIKYV